MPGALVPGSVPVPPEISEIQLGPGTVLYPHPLGTVTPTVPEPPPAAVDAEYVSRLTVHAVPA